MSGSFDSISLEGDLNAIVKEYLIYLGLSKTVSLLESECLESERPINNSMHSEITNYDKIQNVQKQLKDLFREGKREQYLRTWYTHLSPNICDTDDVARKLEFYLYLYFTIYPIKFGDEEEAEESMDIFQRYLQSKGSVLSQTTEFLPYYALPYVPDPRNHPTYKELFTSNWTNDLDVRLDKFLSLALKSNEEPQLIQIYKGSPNTGVHNDMNQLQMKLVDAERRAATYMKRHQKINAEYHNLIGITADLIDALESTIQGKVISAEQVQNLCQQLFNNHMKQSMDLKRPGTAGDALRASVITAQKKSVITSYHSLDYSRLVRDIESSSDYEKGLVIQALRWRLTQSPEKDLRETVVSDYIKADLFGCTNGGYHRDVMSVCLTSSNTIVKQYSVRLLNAIASLSQGRSYLSQNADIVRQMMENLQSKTSNDNVTFENILGCLQKLSLKRVQQNVMIEESVIEWLVGKLKDNDSMSDYTLEYSVALLMNLCLRTSGKKRCISMAQETLTILSDLLGHEYEEIRPYVNGTLYSIMAIPSIREQAKSMGMEEILRCFFKEDKPDMNRQLEFIIKQLNSEEKFKDAESDDEDDDEDEDDLDSFEMELDKDEILDTHDGRCGEVVLENWYTTKPSLDDIKKKKEKQFKSHLTNEPLQRPVTPGHLHSDTQLYVSAKNPKDAARKSESVKDTSVDKDDRPLTRSGSRPVSKQSLKSPDKQMNKNDAKKQTEKISSKALEMQKKKEEQYSAAFGPKPKLPRTPDLYHNSPTKPAVEPPTPTYSSSEPRPSSGGKTHSSSSSRKSSLGTKSDSKSSIIKN